MSKKKRRPGRPRGGKYPQPMRDLWMWDQRYRRANGPKKVEIKNRLKEDFPFVYGMLFGKKRRRKG